MCTFTERCNGQKSFDLILWKKYLTVLRELNLNGPSGWKNVNAGLATHAQALMVIQSFACY